MERKRRRIDCTFEGELAGFAGQAFVAFSPDGTRVVTGHKGDIYRVRNVKTGAPIATLDQPTGPFVHDGLIGFNAQGDRILERGRNGVAALWNANDGKLLLTIGAEFARLSPDGTRFATTDKAGGVTLWEAASGQRIATLETEQVIDRAGLIAEGKADDNDPIFSPDGLRVLTIRKDGTTGLWDARSGKLVAALQGSRAAATNLPDSLELNASQVSVFSPEGSRIHLVGSDRRLLVYDARDGKLTASLKGVAQGRSSVYSSDGRSSAFSPDGRRIVTRTEPSLVVADFRAWSYLCLPVGLLVGLFAALRTEISKPKTAPNEGIRLSARNAILGGIIAALVSVLPIGAASILFGQLNLSNLPYGAALLLTFGILSALWVGGLDVIHHVILRGILFVSQAVPWRCAQLFDQAAEFILLRKVGGGYIFIHRYLLEYFSKRSDTFSTWVQKSS
jgi:WD40 repeat protein